MSFTVASETLSTSLESSINCKLPLPCDLGLLQKMKPVAPAGTC
jgi:hypothetical protein